MGRIGLKQWLLGAGAGVLAGSLAVVAGCDLEGKVGAMDDASGATDDGGGDGDGDGDGGTASAGSGDGDGDGDGAGDGDGDDGLTDEHVCEQTEGTWDPNSCGHYACGNPPDCDAVIPGCDCGLGKTFKDGIGCFEDATCQHPAEQVMCESTGGVWDLAACGHYTCGMPQACQSVIPGCDCGAFSNFVDGVGCEADMACGTGSTLGLGDVCDETADACGAGLACCYPCGIPGCDFECVPADTGGGCPPPMP